MEESKCLEVKNMIFKCINFLGDTKTCRMKYLDQYMKFCDDTPKEQTNTD